MLWITALRYRHRWSQGRLARKLGVRQATVSLWESRGRVPSMRHLLKLGLLFRVADPTALLREAGGRKKHGIAIRPDQEVMR
jgi:transcriptional regulator with XRE-family HTH domain